MTLCAIRNVFIAYDKYTDKIMYIFAVLTLIFGVVTNNRGVVGLLPVIATLLYTVTLKFTKSIVGIKLCILLNTAIWVAYSFIIQDYPTGISDSIVLITTTVSLTAYIITNKKSTT